MPLKETDLKDADTYKKASRQDLSKVTSGNAKFWIYKDVELPAAGGKKQKFPAFLALVDDSGVRKALAGKKVICKGTCGVKEGRIAFEPISGTVPYKLLKVSVPGLLGKPVWIPNGMEEAEGEEETAAASASADSATAAKDAAPPPPPQPAQPDAASKATVASLAGAWNQLVKDAQAFAAAHPERKADLVRDMNTINSLLKADKAAEAKPMMDQVRAALGTAPADSRESAPKQTMEAAQPPSAASAAQVTSRWNALVNQVKAAAAAQPAKKAELVAAAAGAQEALRAGKFEEAAELMNKLDGLLAGNPKEAEYFTRYQALEARLAAALKDPMSDASSLRAISAFAEEKARAGDFEAALTAVERLEQALRSAGSKTATQQEPDEEAEALAPEPEEEGEDAGDEEEEQEVAQFQKNFKKQMITAMAQVRARSPQPDDAQPKPQLRFMAYLAGSANAVIVARKVGHACKKLLIEIAGVPGGKTFQGECIFEKGVHTFVLAAVPGGLASKLSKALRAETGTQYRVKVRAINGSVELDSETDVDPDAVETAETTGSKVRFAKLRLEWDSKKKSVAAQLDSLRQAVLEEYNDAESAEATAKLNNILARFNTGLGDTLDGLYTAADPETQEEFREKSLAIVQAYLTYVDSDPLIGHVEENPFMPVTVRDSLLESLENIQRELQAAG